MALDQGAETPRARGDAATPADRQPIDRDAGAMRGIEELLRSARGRDRRRPRGGAPRAGKRRRSPPERRRDEDQAARLFSTGNRRGSSSRPII